MPPRKAAISDTSQSSLLNFFKKNTAAQEQSPRGQTNVTGTSSSSLTRTVPSPRPGLDGHVSSPQARPQRSASSQKNYATAFGGQPSRVGSSRSRRREAQSGAKNVVPKEKERHGTRGTKKDSIQSTEEDDSEDELAGYMIVVASRKTLTRPTPSPIPAAEVLKRRIPSPSSQLLQEAAAASRGYTLSPLPETAPSLKTTPRSLANSDNSTAHKRRQSSASSWAESLAGAIERPPKLLRPIPPTPTISSTARRRPVFRPSSPALLFSSALSVASRTLSLSSRQSSPESPTVLTPTQDRPLIVRNSQSDEDLDLEPTLIDHKDEIILQEADKPDQYDSDSSLEDIAVILSRRRQAAEALKIPLAAHETGSDRGSKTTRAQGEKSTPRYSAHKQERILLSNAPTYKFSLGALVKETQRNTSAQLAIAKARAALGNNSMVAVGAADQDSSISLLTSVVKQEEGENKIAKLMQAMGRADVLETTTAWHFFNDETNGNKMIPPQYPIFQAGTDDVLSSLKEASSRNHAFLTGFAADIFACSAPSDELLEWIWSSALCEPSLHLADAYIETLKTCPGLAEALDPGRIKSIFERLHANSASVNLDEAIEPIQHPVHARKRTPSQQLLRTIRVLARLADSLPSLSRKYLTEVLLRLGIDHEIISDGETRIVLERLITTLVDGIPPFARDEDLFNIAKTLYKSVQHPILQNRLVSSIPSMSPWTHLLKRRLALAFLLNDRNLLRSSFHDDATATALPAAITKLLDTDVRFSINETTTDYRILSVLISLLDLGIDSGFETPSTGSVNQALHMTSREAEASFNADIDRLTNSIRSLSSRIVDSGASHMARTDAKGLLERLVARLDFAVRTRPKVRRGGWTSVAGGDETWGEENRANKGGWLERWVGKGKAGEKAEVAKTFEIVV